MLALRFCGKRTAESAREVISFSPAHFAPDKSTTARLATSQPHKFQGRICSKRPFVKSRSGRASDEAARGRPWPGGYRINKTKDFSESLHDSLLRPCPCKLSRDRNFDLILFYVLSRISTFKLNLPSSSCNFLSNIGTLTWFTAGSALLRENFIFILRQLFIQILNLIGIWSYLDHRFIFLRI